MRQDYIGILEFIGEVIEVVHVMLEWHDTGLEALQCKRNI
jgi:hypothetical protein